MDIERGDQVCLPEGVCPRSTQRHPSPLPGQSITVESLTGSGAICCWQDKDRRWQRREFPVKMMRLVKSLDIKKMSDYEVRMCGLDAMDSTDPRKNFNPAFKIRLFEARAEWLRRFGRLNWNPFHKMNIEGSTVLARLDDGREVIATVTAIEGEKMHISFGAAVKKIDYAHQIIKII
jgi:hypothetical protein